MRETLVRPAIIRILFASLALAISGCAHRIVQSGHSMPGDYGLFLFAWKLSACPRPDFLPPSHATGEGLELEAGYLDGPYCHDFIKYSVDSGNLAFNGTSPLYVRLERGQQPGCAVYAAVPVGRLCTGVPLSQCPSYQNALAETGRALKVLLAQSGAPALMPNEASLNATGFHDHRAFEEWCAKRIRARFDSTSHDIFHIATPRLEGNPNVE